MTLYTVYSRPCRFDWKVLVIIYMQCLFCVSPDGKTKFISGTKLGWSLRQPDSNLKNTNQNIKKKANAKLSNNESIQHRSSLLFIRVVTFLDVFFIGLSAFRFLVQFNVLCFHLFFSQVIQKNQDLTSKTADPPSAAILAIYLDQAYDLPVRL